MKEPIKKFDDSSRENLFKSYIYYHRYTRELPQGFNIETDYPCRKCYGTREYDYILECDPNYPQDTNMVDCDICTNGYSSCKADMDEFVCWYEFHKKYYEEEMNNYNRYISYINSAKSKLSSNEWNAILSYLRNEK